MMDLPDPPAGYTDTYYARNIAAVGIPAAVSLSGDQDCDVCVVGGGLAGVNTALGLMQRGLSVTLLEAQRPGWGASGRNGGFVARGYAAGSDEIAARVGVEAASALMSLSRASRDLIKRRIEAYGIDCGPLRQGVLTVSWKDRAADIGSYVDQMNRDFDAGLEFWPTDRVREACRTERYFQGYYSPQDFQFDSLRYIHGLMRVLRGGGVAVYEATPAQRIERCDAGQGARWRVIAPGGSVRARHVVLCCSAYIDGLDKRLSNAHFPVQTYVMVTNPVSESDLKDSINTEAALYDMRFACDYYRVLPDRRILWGGRVGLWADPKNVAAILERDMLRVYPQLRGVARAELGWSGAMCYAPHKMPQIGELEPGYWYCTGFGGHGLVPTTVGGEAVAAAIAEGDRRALDLFAPFGLSYAGGLAGRYVAQMVYWLWRLHDYVDLKANYSGS